ncbi:MAG: hypothetical protein ACMUHX_04575 [bacterium]
MIAAWTLTIFLGLLFGVAELLSKFKDEPFNVIKGNATAWGYIILNLIIVSVAFYFLTKTSLFGKMETDLLKAALTAGLGSSLLMRSKFLKVNISGKEAAVGPEIIVNVLLETLEKKIDRDRAIVRKDLVEELMVDIDFSRAKDYVVTTIIASSQINSEETTKAVMKEAEKIENSPIDDIEKSYALGYLVMDIMGEKFLKGLFNNKNKERFKREKIKEV